MTAAAISLASGQPTSSRVFLSHHVGAGGIGNQDLLSLLDVRQKRVDVAARHTLGELDVAGFEGGHAAAVLFRRSSARYRLFA